MQGRATPVAERERQVARSAKKLAKPLDRLQEPSDLRLLAYFVRLAASGSMTKAAEALDIPSAALARHVAALEAQLQAKLFERRGPRQSLTESGKLLLTHCEAISGQLQAMNADLGRIAANPATLTVLGMPPTTSAVLSARIAERFLRQLPHARLKFIDGFSGHIREWLTSGRIDVGVLYNSPGVIGEDLRTEDLFVLGLPELLKHTDVFPFRDLANLPMVLPSMRHGMRMLIDRNAREYGVDLNIVIEVESIATVLDLVENGICVTILPSATAERAASRLRRLRIVEPVLSRTLVLATSTGKPVTPTTRVLLNIIREEAQKTGSASSRAAGGKAVSQRPTSS